MVNFDYLAFEEKVVLDTLYFQEETRHRPTSASLAFEECFGKWIGPDIVSKYWRHRKFPASERGGAREPLSDYRMRRIFKEFGNSKGIDVIAVSSMTGQPPYRLIERCEQLGLPYYNASRKNGNGKAEDIFRSPESISPNGRRRFSKIGKG